MTEVKMTEAEDQAGAVALKTYIDNMLEANGMAWEELFIPDSVYLTGAKDAIEAADASEDTSTAGRSAAACTALRAAIDSTGHGSQVSDLNIQEGVAAILTAVAKVRAQENPPSSGKPEPAPVPAPEGEGVSTTPSSGGNPNVVNIDPSRPD